MLLSSFATINLVALLDFVIVDTVVPASFQRWRRNSRNSKYENKLLHLLRSCIIVECTLFCCFDHCALFQAKYVIAWVSIIATFLYTPKGKGGFVDFYWSNETRTLFRLVEYKANSLPFPFGWFRKVAIIEASPISLAGHRPPLAHLLIQKDSPHDYFGPVRLSEISCTRHFPKSDNFIFQTENVPDLLYLI